MDRVFQVCPTDTLGAPRLLRGYDAGALAAMRWLAHVAFYAFSCSVLRVARLGSTAQPWAQTPLTSTIKEAQYSCTLKNS